MGYLLAGTYQNTQIKHVIVWGRRGGKYTKRGEQENRQKFFVICLARLLFTAAGRACERRSQKRRIAIPLDTFRALETKIAAPTQERLFA